MRIGKKIRYKTPQMSIHYFFDEDIVTASEIIAGDGYFNGVYSEVWE
ncbi:MAG: hypothetical protein IJA89_04975 [Clostridia bacterium]|nr:hypothetical protein [Clostridia bacterium]